MVAGILIIAFSLALLIYWFRYSCILILQNEHHTSDSAALADERFSFSSVTRDLSAAANLDPLRSALDRDYRVLTYLMEHAAGLELAGIEERLLILDYRLMQTLYSVTRVIAPEQARRSLAEMAAILGILAQRLGRQAGAADA